MRRAQAMRETMLCGLEEVRSGAPSARQLLGLQVQGREGSSASPLPSLQGLSPVPAQLLGLLG